MKSIGGIALIYLFKVAGFSVNKSSPVLNSAARSAWVE